MRLLAVETVQGQVDVWAQQQGLGPVDVWAQQRTGTGGRMGTATGAAIGVVVGVPKSKTSIAFICGSLIPAINSIVIAPSVTNVSNVTMYGTSLPGAARNMSMLLITNEPST
jgi:hypothetical protein